MALHGIKQITLGIPNLEETRDYYRDFGLIETRPGTFASHQWGEQLRLVPAAKRGLLHMLVAADDSDDIDRIEHNLARLRVPATRAGNTIEAAAPGTPFNVRVEVIPRLARPAELALPLNGPGRIGRAGRSPVTIRRYGAKPRKLGHVVWGTPDFEACKEFFLAGIGFKLSDLIRGRAAFTRCSPDHHNAFLFYSPKYFFQHHAWEVADFDEIGSGAEKVISKNPARHIWGFGRHTFGSNLFWYLRDPAGNYSEFYSDLDQIGEEEMWTPLDLKPDTSPLLGWGDKQPKIFNEPPDIFPELYQNGEPTSRIGSRAETPLSAFVERSITRPGA